MIPLAMIFYPSAVDFVAASAGYCRNKYDSLLCYCECHHGDTKRAPHGRPAVCVRVPPRTFGGRRRNAVLRTRLQYGVHGPVGVGRAVPRRAARRGLSFHGPPVCFHARPLMGPGA